MNDGALLEPAIRAFARERSPGRRVHADELAGLPLFEAIGRPLLNGLALQFSRGRHPPGSVLMHRGGHFGKLQIITRGIVGLTSDAKQGCGVLLLSDKDLIMPVAGLFAEASLVTASALTSVHTLEIDTCHVRAALERSPALALNMMKAIGGQWRMALRSILDLNCRSAAQRVGAFLLHYADLHDGVTPVLPFPQRKLAARLGTTPETLSRSLQTVADHGLLLRGRTVLVRDRATIEEFCGPDPYPGRDERPLGVFAF